MNNPWKGLACYEEEDLNQYQFCGRNNSIGELNTLIQNNLCITMYGRTGIGKTSLLKAGVFPLLRANNYLPVLVRFNDMDEDDESTFAECIINRINQLVPEIKVNDYAHSSGGDVDVLWEYFATRHFYNAQGAEVFPTIVLDQFEENFLRKKMKRKAWHLMEQLYALTDDNKAFPEGYHDETNFRIVISIREDDLYRLEDCIDKLNLSEFKYNRYRLVQLTDADAEEIICIPGERVLPEDKATRDAVVAKIIALVRSDSDNGLSTLMLSLVCSQLFNNAVESGNPVITENLVDGMDKNLLQGFYTHVIGFLPNEEERFYLEDNLVDAHGRRNSINKDIVEECCPSWRLLTEGTHRILQETNGKVELVHDMLAYAIYNVRETRMEEQKRKEEEQKRKEEEQKKAEIRRRKLKNAFTLLVLSLVLTFAVIFIVQYEKMKETNQKMLVNRARAVSGKAMELFNRGDSYTARLLALAVLDDLENNKCQHVPDAEAALRNAYLSELAIFEGHNNLVYSVAYSPDGNRIVSASSDSTIRIWDALTGASLLVLKGHDNEVYSAAYSPDGNRIVSASADSTIRIWDVETGDTLRVLKGHRDVVWSAAYSPDGNRIVSASYDSTIRIWDVETGDTLRVLKGHRDVVWSAAYSPDGNRIVSASADSTIRIWDANTWQPIDTLKGHTAAVRLAAYSPDGNRIVSASFDCSARIWDALTGEVLDTLNGHENVVWSAFFSPDGKRVVSASLDGWLGIWDSETGEPLNARECYMPIAAYSPDGSRMVSSFWDGPIYLWELIRDDSQDTLIGHTQGVSTVKYSPDGKYIISASSDSTVRIWDVETDSCRVLKGHTGSVGTAAYSPDGKYIVSASEDSTLRIWNVGTSDTLRVLKGHTGEVRSAAYSPDGKCVVSASVDSTIRIWDVETDSCRVLKVPTGYAGWIAYSRDGKYIVSTSNGNSNYTILLWSAHTGDLLRTFKGHTDYVRETVFSYDGNYIVSASNDKSIRIWDAKTGKQVNVLKGHNNKVSSVAYSPNDSLIVSASHDGTIRVWDANLGLELSVFEGHSDYVYSVAFSPDGKHIISASADGTVRVWEWKPLQELIDETRERFKNRTLTPEERKKYYLD